MPGKLVATPLSDSLFLRACARRKTERVPVWLMRQAGRYQASYRALRARVGMLELCKTPDLASQVTVEAVRQLGVDAAIIFSDLLLPAEPMGLALEYAEGDGPRLSPPIRSAADVERLRPVDVADSLGFVMEAIRRTRLALPADIPLLGFAGAPFTLASYMIEGGSSRHYVLTKTFMTRETAAWHKLMAKISAVSADLLNQQLEAGAQAVQLFDSWAGVLTRADYDTYVLPHSRSVLSGVKKGAPVIHFGAQCGHLMESMRKAGGTVLGLDWRQHVGEARRRLPGRAVMGNLDPAVLFAPQAVIRKETRRILKEAGAAPGFIFNLGHGVLPGTPVENVQYLVETVKELGRR